MVHTAIPISHPTTAADILSKHYLNSKELVPLVSKVIEARAWREGSICCGSASMRGFRPHMEDASVFLAPLSADSTSYRFCGVFDGHAQSRKVADALTELLPRKISDQKQKYWMSRACLERACVEADKEILRSANSDAGSTAIFCILKTPLSKSNNNQPMPSVTATLGSVGDSQAMVIHSDFSKQPTVVFLNEIHRPQLMDSESIRIKRAGGFIVNNRVDGELAVSRAFGDAKYKRDISKKLCDQKVVALPAVAESVPLVPGDTLVLGCDGLFDVMTPFQIDSFVRSCLVAVLLSRASRGEQRTAPNNLWTYAECLSEVAGKLIDEALLRGSRDNISVMLIQTAPKGRTESSIEWSEKYSKKYIPPVLFPSGAVSLVPSAYFLSVLRDELKEFGLDEDLTLSQAERIESENFPPCGFHPSLSRYQMAQVLQSALGRQWAHRDSWVRLADWEIPAHRRKSKLGGKHMGWWNKMVKSLSCFGAVVEKGDEQKPTPGGLIEQTKRRHSSSVGMYSKVSSLHSVPEAGNFGIVSSINSVPITSRQTSAALDDVNNPELIDSPQNNSGLQTPTLRDRHIRHSSLSLNN